MKTQKMVRNWTKALRIGSRAIHLSLKWLFVSSTTVLADEHTNGMHHLSTAHRVLHRTFSRSDPSFHMRTDDSPYGRDVTGKFGRQICYMYNLQMRAFLVFFSFFQKSSLRVCTITDA